MPLIPATSGGSGSEKFPTTSEAIGTYNGSTVYRKVVPITLSYDSSGVARNTHGLPSGYNLIRLSAVVKSASTATRVLLPALASTLNNSVNIYLDDTNIVCNSAGKGYANASGLAIIDYYL